MAASFSSWPHSPILAPLKLSPHDDKARQKRPRHRHSPSQLAALNDLYETTEHPPLDLRTDLAERLGMETKTVNAWFQNKRASAKKRSRGGAPYDVPHPSSTSSSLVHTSPQPDLDDYQDGDLPAYNNHKQRSSVSASLRNHRQQSPFHPGTPEHTQFFAESDSMPRKMRIRPSTQQTEALKRFYKTNPHPSKEDREELGERIGMRYQSITNWFQNQRSLAKKRNEDVDSQNTSTNKKSTTVQSHESRTFSAFPPPSNHPSLSLSLHSSHHRTSAPRARRSTTRVAQVSPVEAPLSSRGSTPGSVGASNRNTAGTLSRPRRTRPEPYQLDALKDLFTRTSNPSIEERSALALEIGMDVGKVTNWFRNLRQTARKRAKKGDEDDDGNVHSSSVSRAGTPSFRSSSSSSANEQDDHMDLDDSYQSHFGRGYGAAQSDMASDDEYQEAVTPSPEPSPPPPPSIPATMSTHRIRVGLHPVKDHGSYAELDKANAARFSGVKLDDALLLLSFHHHIARSTPIA